MVSPAPRNTWRRLYENDPTATLFQSPVWTDALSDYTHWVDASRYYEVSDGRALVLPLARRGPRTAAGVYASMPAGWGMGGFVCSDELCSEVASAAIADIQRLKPLGARILPNPIRGETWNSAVLGKATALPRYSHVLPLGKTYEQVWADSFRRLARGNVNRALRSGLDVERDTTGRLVPIYRRLFSRSVERWAEQNHEPPWLARARSFRVDPVAKLEYLAAALGDQMVTWVASYHREPAAALIVLRGTSVFAWRAAMHEKLGPDTHAPSLLHHHAISEACADDAPFYYFGESGSSSGIAFFKERFGAIGLSYPEIRLEQMPYTRTSQFVRGAVKRVVGYAAN